jgi:hypothetical protein
MLTTMLPWRAFLLRRELGAVSALRVDLLCLRKQREAPAAARIELICSVPCLARLCTLVRSDKSFCSVPRVVMRVHSASMPCWSVARVHVLSKHAARAANSRRERSAWLIGPRGHQLTRGGLCAYLCVLSGVRGSPSAHLSGAGLGPA